MGGLLVHQVGRVTEFGLAEIRRNVAPVFAVALPPRLTVLLQLAALPAALVAVLLRPAGGLVVGLVLVLLWLLSVQRRLANHVWLAAISLLVLACVPVGVTPVVFRDLLAGLYLSAAVFKMTSEYLFGQRSPGRVIADHYARAVGLRVPAHLLRWVPTVVVAVELVVGVLIMVPGMELWAMYMALAMHWMFGITGNFPFAVIAMVLWTAALSPDAVGPVLPVPHNPAWIALPVSLVAAVVFRWRAGKLRGWPFVVRDAVDSTAFGVLAAIALSYSRAGGPAVLPAAAVAHWVVGALFLLNAALVYCGVKLEWSFAMFSGMRPFGRSWWQRGGLRDWPRYYSLTLPDKVPAQLVRDIGPSFLYKVTRADAVVHESVVHHLEKAAARSRTTFSPRTMVSNPRTGDLEPVEDSPRPRRTPLLFPAVIPRKFDEIYLG
ncbi:hypothetical protein [Streptomyces sp. NPDC058964]|uniref:hypothetical protein n=1 Tax=Streptomyces sp. NPDC058964 TaxID=3346681 RepID=UPI0036943909